MIIEARGFGETIDEAKEKAILELNAPEEADIQFEIISFPKKKALGLFGGSKAEVKVFVELPDPKPQKAQAKREAKNEKKAAVKPVKAEKTEEAKETSKKYDINEGYGEAKDASELPEDSKPARAVAYLKTILSSLGCENVSFKVAEKENAALIELDGENLGVVIGHRGETLDSLQYLTSLAANNGGGYYKVALNIGNYREKREEALVSLANRIAAQVLKTGKSRALEPMNPYERRIIHTAVQQIDGVVSNSFGEGSRRRVLIATEGGDMRPPRRDNSRRGNGGSSRRGGRSNKPAVTSAPAREPRRDSDLPLYGKIN